RRAAAADQRHVLGSFVAVNEKAVLGLADIAFLAGGDQYAEIVGQPGLGLAAVANFPLVAAADAHGVFVGVFVASSIQQRFPHRGALGFAVAAVLAAPRNQFRCEKIAVAVVHQRRRRAVLEFQKSRVVTGDRPAFEPLTNG